MLPTNCHVARGVANGGSNCDDVLVAIPVDLRPVRGQQVVF